MSVRDASPISSASSGSSSDDDDDESGSEESGSDSEGDDNEKQEKKTKKVEKMDVDKKVDAVKKVIKLTVKFLIFVLYVFLHCCLFRRKVLRKRSCHVEKARLRIFPMTKI